MVHKKDDSRCPVTDSRCPVAQHPTYEGSELQVTSITFINNDMGLSLLGHSNDITQQSICPVKTIEALSNLAFGALPLQ